MNEKQPNLETTIDQKVMEQIKDDMRNLYRNADEPIAVLLQTMDTAEFNAVISGEVANPIREKLQNLVFNGEDDFVEKIIKIAMPILVLTKKGKQNAYKQEGREMFTDIDVKETVSIIEKADARVVYVVGNVGSGKSTFAKDLSRETGYKNIDIDHWFQIYRQEQKSEADGLSDLLDYVLQKEKPPIVINHADLLRQEVIKDADVVVFLNPKIEEQLKSRRIRGESGADGEWKNVAANEYEEIAVQNLDAFKNLEGEIEYKNEKSGTMVKVIKVR